MDSARSCSPLFWFPACAILLVGGLCGPAGGFEIDAADATAAAESAVVGPVLPPIAESLWFEDVPPPGVFLPAVEGPVFVPSDPHFPPPPNMIGGALAPPLVIQFGPGPDRIVRPPLGGGRLLVGENNSPLPRTRAHVGWNHRQNAWPLTGQDQHRFMIGAESVLADPRVSLEVRAPFTLAPPSDVQFGFPPPASVGRERVEFGNLSLIVKSLMYANPGGHVFVSAGAGFEFPTAPGMRVVQRNVPLPLVTTRQWHVKNEAIHVSPFLAALVLPSERLFLQSFLQLDMPIKGNFATLIDDQVGAPAPVRARDRVRSQTLVNLSLSAGWWLYRDGAAVVPGPSADCGCADGFLGGFAYRGLAFMAETHYTATLNEAHIVPGPAPTLLVGNTFGRMNLWSQTLGLTADLGNSTLTLAWLVPLTRSDRGVRLYDQGLMVQYNWFF